MANIFAQFARPVRSIADYQGQAQQQEANALTLEGARRKNAMDAMTMQQGQEKRNALQSIASGLPAGATARQRIDAYRANPLTMDVGDSLEKADLERQKTEAEVKDKTVAAREKLLNLGKSAVGMVVANPTPEALEAVIAAYEADAEQITGKRDNTTRALFQGATTPEQIRERAMRISLALEKQLPKTGTTNLGGTMDFNSTDPVTGAVTTNRTADITQSADNAATQATSRDNNAATNARTAADNAAARGVQIRGQNMTDGRARERLEFDKVDSVRKLGEKPLNDTQSKALLFGSRMREADKVLDELAKSGTTTSVPGSRSGYGVGSVVTAMSSSQKQQLDQAKRDFVNAVLRRESGAVIADSEFDNADKQYFPQIGDKPATIAQKARNRKLAIDGILQEVPENRRDSLKPQPTLPTADDVRKQADAILKGG